MYAEDFYQVIFSLVCEAYNSMLVSKPPDLILDSSRSGHASQAAKALARAHGIPALSLTYDNKLENLYVIVD